MKRLRDLNPLIRYLHKKENVAKRKKEIYNPKKY
jgi:hypothetical protein